MKDYLLETFIVKELTVYQFEAIETFFMENHFACEFYNPASSQILVNFPFRVWEASESYFRHDEKRELNYDSFKNMCSLYGYKFNEYSNNRWITDDTFILDDSSLFALKNLSEYISLSKKTPKQLIIKASITKLPQKQFFGFKDIESLIITSPLDSISAQCFAYCDNLKEVILPSSIKYIRYGAFRGCKRLLGLRLPENLYEIEDYAFEECSSLNQLVFPEKLKRLGICAFKNCGLQKAIFPVDLSYIGHDCFVGNSLDCESIEYYQNPEIRETRKYYDEKREYLIRNQIIETTKEKIFSKKLAKVLEDQIGITQRDSYIKSLEEERDELYSSLENIENNLKKREVDYGTLKKDYEGINNLLIDKGDELIKQKDLNEKNIIELEKLKNKYVKLIDDNEEIAQKNEITIADLRETITGLHSDISGFEEKVKKLEEEARGNDVVVTILSVSLIIAIVILFWSI